MFPLNFQLCKELGGEIPDLVNFGKPGSEKRERFVTDMFLSVRIPRVVSNVLDQEATGEIGADEEAIIDHETPLNMVSGYCVSF